MFLLTAMLVEPDSRRTIRHTPRIDGRLRAAAIMPQKGE
jgi:hypothetical protein